MCQPMKLLLLFVCFHIHMTIFLSLWCGRMQCSISEWCSKKWSSSNVKEVMWLDSRKEAELIAIAANHWNTQRTLLKTDLRYIDKGVYYAFFFSFDLSYLLHHLQFIFVVVFLPYILSSLGEMESGRLVLCDQNEQDIFLRTSLVRIF